MSKTFKKLISTVLTIALLLNLFITVNAKSNNRYIPGNTENIIIDFYQKNSSTYEVKITNNRQKPITNWVLSFKTNFKLSNPQGVNFSVSKDNTYTFTPKSSTVIDVGSNFTFTVNSDKKQNSELHNVDFKYEEVTDPLKIDYDKDKLPDYIEELLGTDKIKDDTDGDGLKDGFEFAYLTTSLFMIDTDKNGISDADEDFDSDGLTNIQEQNLGTRPDMVDTDGDGLSDVDEVKVYKTNPLSKDTDGDGLTDSEEIKLGLNPNNVKTDGTTPDNERMFAQAASDSVKDDALHNSKNWLMPAISGNVPGYISNNVKLEKSSNDAYDDNRAVLSDVIDVNTTYKTPLTLSFTYNQTYTGNIKNLTIVSAGEDGPQIIDTVIDEASRMISGKITGNGTYFVIDLDEFLKGLGINVFANISAPSSEPSISTFAKHDIGTDDTQSTDAKFDYIYDNEGNIIDKIDRASANSNELNSPLSTNSIRPFTTAAGATGKADIVFVVDTTGSMSGAISGVKNNVNTFAERLVNDYNIDANFSLIEFRDITVDGLNSTKQHKNLSSNWFTNVTAFNNEVNTLYASGGGDTPETPIDGLEMARRLDWREDATKFVVLITDADYKTNNNYGISGMDEMVNSFANDGIIVSAITYNDSVYSSLTNGTGGLYGYIYGNFSDILLGLADKVGQVTNTGGEWVFLDDFQAVKLSDTLANASVNDTDNDGLTDAQELGTSTEKDMLPYISALTNKHSIPVEYYQGKTKLTVWKYLSNPTKEDTDNDGLKDGRSTIINGNVITPKDPQPRSADKMAKVWKAQINQAQSGNIPQNYQASFMDNINNVDDFLDNIFNKYGLNDNIFVEAINNITKAAVKKVIDFALSNRSLLLDHSSGLSDVIKTIKHILSFVTSNDTAAKIAADTGAFILNFRLDEDSVAYHAQPDTWQKAFGYNDLYDDVFDIGTDMRFSKLYFNYNNNLNVIWAWRGDYWNLGAGAEIGVYKYDRSVSGTEHFNALDFNLPMTLNLYNVNGSTVSYFNWSPTEEQWWITGFNYHYQNPDAGKLVSLGSIDLSEHPDIYTQIKNASAVDRNDALKGTQKLLNYSIFDDDNKIIWLMWYDSK